MCASNDSLHVKNPSRNIRVLSYSQSALCHVSGTKQSRGNLQLRHSGNLGLTRDRPSAIEDVPVRCKMDNTLDQKTTPNQFQMIAVTQDVFYSYIELS